MTSSFRRGARQTMQLLVLSTLLITAACHSYRLPSPTGPPQPKTKAHASKGANGANNDMADGSAQDKGAEAAKPQRNSYDKNGLLKKPKLERRRLKHKVGQRRFLGFVLPF